MKLFKLPPGGDLGLPILGETGKLLKNGFAFVEAGARNTDRSSRRPSSAGPRRSSPGPMPAAGLSRILAATTEGGRGITTDEAKMELHHIVVAGLIVWAWFVESILELDRRPEIRERLIGDTGRTVRRAR